MTNQGRTRLTNLVVRDPIPDDTVYEGSDDVPAPTLDGNVLVWQIDSLAGGNSVQLSFRVRVRADASLSAIINMATVNTTEIPRAESNQIQHPLTEPTAIDLVRFHVTRAGQDNTVHWRTGAELDTFGFHLWRAATPALSNRASISTSLLALSIRGARMNMPGNGFSPSTGIKSSVTKLSLCRPKALRRTVMAISPSGSR